MTLPVLKLDPCLVSRPWGGNRLGGKLGKKVAEGERIGESWELSDHPDGPSRVEGGPHEGRLFGDLVRELPREMVAREQPPDRYPLLVKYIDAGEDLSIQVHPSDAYTREHSIADRGKTECWYVLDCDPETEIIYGLRNGIDRSDLKAAISSKTVPDVVNRIPLSPGTFLFVPPGTVHAILGGTLICEIQQSSNVTYRLWDWDRKPERELHIQESLDVIDYRPRRAYEAFQLRGDTPVVPTIVTLTYNPFFLVQAIQLSRGQSIDKPQPGTGVIINGVRGSGSLEDQPISEGDTFFVPACLPSFRLTATDSPLTVLISRPNQ